MDKIRIGKDIAIKWSILTNGIPQSLEGRDLLLVLADPFGNCSTPAFSVDGNTVSLTYRGTEQRILGTYRLTLWENYGKPGQTAVDACQAFTLVRFSCLEDNCESSSIETEFVDIGTSDMQLNPVYGIYSDSIRYIRTMTQEEYDILEVKDESTLYIIVE